MYVKSNILMLADMFVNFQRLFFEIYELNPACFLTKTWISMTSSIKKG